MTGSVLKLELELELERARGHVLPIPHLQIRRDKAGVAVQRQTNRHKLRRAESHHGRLR